MTGNCAVVAPAGTVTAGGTTMAALSLARATVTPPAGAGAFKVMTPFVVRLPTRRPVCRVTANESFGNTGSVAVHG